METPATPYLTSLSERFALIMVNLCHTVGWCVAKHRAGFSGYFVAQAIVPLQVPIWDRFTKLRKQVEKLLAKLATGWRPVAAKPRAYAKREMKVATGVRLPTKFGWLVGLSQETARYGAFLQDLLSEPETIALVAEVSPLRRLLRPICHALGMQPGPPLGPVVRPPSSGPAVPRDNQGRYCKPQPPARRPGRHWIEPYPGTDIRFEVV